MNKSYDQLKNSVRFYRTVMVLFLALILFIGFNNVSTTNQCKKFEDDLNKANATNKVLAEELKQTKQDIVMGTCLLISKL